MAQTGYAKALLGGLPDDLKVALTRILEYIVPNGKFGPPDDRAKSESFSAFYMVSTTATSTGEFSIQHGMGRTPYVAIPVLALNSSVYHLPVLSVTRPADGQRLYLKAEAGSTNQVFVLLVE